MLVEKYSPDDFETRNLWPLFLQHARASFVPAVFGVVASSELRKVPTSLQRSVFPYQPFHEQYRNAAVRLVKNSFYSPALACYAILYGKTISAFKMWDSSSAIIRDIREKVHVRGERYWLNFKNEGGVPLFSHEGLERGYTILDQADARERELRQEAVSASKGILALEHMWFVLMPGLEKRLQDAIGVSSVTIPRLPDIQYAIEYMEEYFVEPKNRMLIKRMLTGTEDLAESA